MHRQRRPGLTASVALACALWGPGMAAQDAPVAPAPDGAPARVADREGFAARRPAGVTRWAAVGAHDACAPGDWLKTGARGANALALRLGGGGAAVLGPGGLLEVADAATLRLHAGECEVTAPEAAPVTVHGPSDASQRVTGRAVLRATANGLDRLEADPRWLAGYRADTSTEALGELLATIDGRNVPLTIGTHKVTIDVRDGIARTEVEQSFVNHTPNVLEGVFYFPLPADASVSGFGMWIGDELVDADIVEKQRARAIYETILRERRDPGLLEWTGGNLFKARVFPIGAEKRIRISYTQVLPRRGHTWTYRYALRSDATRQQPLKQLEIVARVWSEAPITAFASPSHTGRVRVDGHAASFEHAADEVVPERDFELRCTTASPGPMEFLAHRRADDGYFLLAFDAPSAASDAKRAEPLEVIVLADTSGSMAGPAREAQAAFIEALLAALGPQDRFALATCDVETAFAGAGVAANTDAHRAAALAALDRRAPLGWTDLDRGLAAVAERATPATHIVYVGDGIATAGDGDPAAAARRLAALHRGRGTWHAVVPGSVSEPIVLRAIAACGGGSWRAIDPQEPSATAFELLAEIARPAVKGCTLRFEGAAVAAVHPAELPNLPAGQRQVVVGRYDAAAGPLAGRAVLTGTLGGKPVEYSVALAGPTADEGNSFIPRFWARRHLDHLLAQGRDPAIRDQIIGLSVDFQIMTPYTSFLVLESDADRERFQVARKFRMRDGEAFFAAGRGAAVTALARQQMLAAKAWRQDLRARLLRELRDMHRGLTWQLEDAIGPLTSTAAGVGGAAGRWGFNRPVASSESRNGLDEGFDHNETPDDALEGEEARDAGADADRGEANEDAPEQAQEAEPPGESSPTSPSSPTAPSSRPMEAKAQAAGGPVAGRRQARARERGFAADGLRARGDRDDRYGWGNTPDQQLHALFPPIPDPPGPPGAIPEWPAEVRDLLAALDRRPVLAALAGALRFTSGGESRDRRGRVSAHGTGTWLLTHDGWITDTAHLPGQGHQLDWHWAGERGVLAAAWGLGRRRPARAGDERGFPAPHAWLFGGEWAGYAGWTATLGRDTPGTVKLTFRAPGENRQDLVLRIDPLKRLPVESWWERDGTRSGHVRYGDATGAGGAVEVTGAWWPVRVESLDADGRVTATSTFAVVSLDADQAAATAARLLAARDGALILGPAPARIEAALQAADAGTSTLEERWACTLHYAATQRWDAVAPHLLAFEALAAGRRGLDSVRLTVRQLQRQGAEARTLALAMAQALAAPARDADLGAAFDLANRAGLAGAELRELLGALAPVFARRGAVPGASLQRDWLELQAWQQLGDPDGLRAFLEAMVQRHPNDAQAHTQLAWHRANAGDLDGAVAALERLLAEGGPWEPGESSNLRYQLTNLLWNHRRYEAYLRVVEAWERESPDTFPAHLAQQQLSALHQLGRDDAAGALEREWLAAAPDTPAALARLQAALQHVLGQDWSGGRRVVDDAAGALAAAAAERLLEHPTAAGLAGLVFGNPNAMRAPAGVRLRAALRARVLAEAGTLPPPALQRFLGWLQQAGVDPAAAEHGFAPAIATALARWEAMGDARARGPLAEIVETWGTVEQRLQLRRRALARATTPSDARDAAAILLGLLLEQPWSAAAQAEAAALLPRLAPPAGVDPAQHESLVDAWGLSLCRCVDHWTEGRAAAEVAARPESNTLTRRQRAQALAAAAAEARRAAHGAMTPLADALAGTAMAPWVAIEEAWLAVRTRADLARAWTTALGLLGAVPDRATDTAGDATAPRERRAGILASRAAATLLRISLLAPDPTREAALVAAIDAGLARPESLLDWREVRHAFLLAHGRDAELRAALVAWFGEGTERSLMRWGRALAELQAERGELLAAIATLERLRGAHELGHAEWRRVADWALALGDTARVDAARERSWELLDEWTLAARVQQDAAGVARQGDDAPDELDPEAVVRLRVLLRKAEHPANHLWVVQQCYAPTKDFRLLECLAEGVVGHSPQAIYGFLQSLGALFGQIHDEATVDRIVAHGAAVRARCASDTDRRALRLLELAAVRGAATQAQGAAPHVERVAAALAAAFDGEWAEGERVTYGAWIASLGPLAGRCFDEQVRQLRALRADEPAGSFGRCQLGGHTAQLLWAAGQREAALVELASALTERRAAPGGRLPEDAMSWLEAHGQWLLAQAQFRAAEGLWADERARGYPTARDRWLLQQMFATQAAALAARAPVQLGEGATLYRALREALATALGDAGGDGTHAQQLLQTLCQVFGIAHGRLRLDGVAADCRRFAFGDLPAVLGRVEPHFATSLAATMAGTLQSVAGPLTALEFLVVRLENEPAAARWQWHGLWPQQGWHLADLRAAAGALPAALEERLLAIVLRELRRDLETGQSRQNSFYWRQHRFWEARAADFAKLAHEVLAARASHEPTVRYVATYLADGLQLPAEAADALAAALRAGILSLDGHEQLVHVQHRVERWAASLPVIDALVAARPERVDYRVLRMRALHRLRRGDDVVATHGAAVEWFRAQSRWHEDVVAALASACLETGLLDDALAHLREAVNVHVRGRADRGVGDGTLAGYYRQLAETLSGRGETSAAVDAAAGAVVAWGGDQASRARALDALTRVLAGAKDLDGYLVHLDAEVARTGLENPLLRKSVGAVLLARGRSADAAQQLAAAVAAAPEDREIHALHVRALDAAGRAADAAAAALAAAQVAARDVALWTDAADRHARLGDGATAERARTTLVEALFGEAEGHAALAAVRSGQGRHADAAAQWRLAVAHRTDEAPHWLALAESLLVAGDPAECRRVCEQVLARDWDDRFGDVHAQARALLDRGAARAR